MISRRKIISGFTLSIFAIFSPNESVLGADDRSGPLFPISQGTLPWQPSLWKNGKLRTFVVWHLETEWDIAISMWALTAQMMLYIVWKFREIRSSNSRVDRTHLRTSGTTWPKTGVFSQISPDILDRFSQSFHYMKSLYVQMMDLYLIFLFVKGRCHGNQIILP